MTGDGVPLPPLRRPGRPATPVQPPVPTMFSAHEWQDIVAIGPHVNGRPAAGPIHRVRGRGGGLAPPVFSGHSIGWGPGEMKHAPVCLGSSPKVAEPLVPIVT